MNTVDGWKFSGVTTVVAATAVLRGPAGLGGPARPGLIMSTVTQLQWINKYEIKQLYLVDQIVTEISNILSKFSILYILYI